MKLIILNDLSSQDFENMPVLRSSLGCD